MERPFPRTAFFIVGALLIWAADFLFLYVFAALACARGYSDVAVMGINVLPFATGVSTGIALIASAVLFITARRRAGSLMPDGGGGTNVAFIGGAACVAVLLAVIAIVFTALPGLMLRTCGG